MSSEAVVATYNIRHGRGLDDRVDLERIAGVIRNSGADLIALQEVDRFYRRSGEVDQPAELERLTGLKLIYVPTIARKGREFGFALAGHPDQLGTHKVFDLPRYGREERRKALACEWRGLTVFTSHLAVERRANRPQQEALADLVRPEARRAVILGDLNATGWGVRTLTRLGLARARPFGGTINPWWRFRQIDHILTGPGIEQRGARILEAGPSDHRPVSTSLRWRVEDVSDVTYDA